MEWIKRLENSGDRQSVMDERQLFSALLAFLLGFAMCGTVISLNVLVNGVATHSHAAR